MTDKKIILQAIEKYRNGQAGVPVDIVTQYLENCVDFWGENSSIYRAEIAMHSVIRVANEMLDELRQMEDANTGNMVNQ